MNQRLQDLSVTQASLSKWNGLHICEGTIHSSITFLLAAQRQSVQWIIPLIAAAARDGL
jgi:hypothetical protein